MICYVLVLGSMFNGVILMVFFLWGEGGDVDLDL